MPDVDASIVFLPRFTTLVGAPGSSTIFEFTTLPLDVSRHGGAQFQIWRGPISGGTFTFFMEESLDAQKWVLGASTPEGVVLAADETKFCSYSFRLRWFRIRIQLTGAAWPIVTCWAEGLLRGGGGGVWPAPMASAPPPGVSGAVTPSGFDRLALKKLIDSEVFERFRRGGGFGLYRGTLQPGGQGGGKL